MNCNNEKQKGLKLASPEEDINYVVMKSVPIHPHPLLLKEAICSQPMLSPTAQQNHLNNRRGSVYENYPNYECSENTIIKEDCNNGTSSLTQPLEESYYINMKPVLIHPCPHMLILKEATYSLNKMSPTAHHNHLNNRRESFYENINEHVLHKKYGHSGNILGYSYKESSRKNEDIKEAFNHNKSNRKKLIAAFSLLSLSFSGMF